MTEIEIPPRMRHLERDHRGFIVPWFVQWLDDNDRPLPAGQGRPDFRVMDRRKWVKAIQHRLCWVCGGPVGVHLAFLIGPMCAINRVTSEPPSHRECALYSTAVCPFLSRPRMRRNEKDVPEHKEIAGFHLEHNPGAMALWTTRSFRVFNADQGGQGQLITIGDPEKIEWFAEGRRATKDEVRAAIDKGLPSLRKLAEEEGPDAIADLEQQLKRALPLLPA